MEGAREGCRKASAIKAFVYPLETTTSQVCVPGIIRPLWSAAEDVVERMVVKSAFKPPPAKVIAMKPIERLRTNREPIPPLALRDRVL